MRRRAALLLLLTAALLAGAAPAGAGVEQVVDGLRAQPLYVSPTSGIRPDAGLVLPALAAAAVPTYVVVVPQADADAEQLGIDGLVLRIVEQLARPEAVVLVVTDGQELQAAGGGQSGVDPGATLEAVLTARIQEPFTASTLTGAIVDFTRQLGAGRTPASSGPSGGLTRRTVGVVGLVAVAALTGGWIYLRSSRRADPPEPSADPPDPAQSEEGILGT